MRNTDSNNYSEEQNEKFENFVTDLFINAIEKGTAPWQKPWTTQEILDAEARNPETGTIYQGQNQTILMTQSLLNGYNDPRWLTFNQAKAIGGMVNKGEKGTLLKKVIYDRDVPKLDENGKPLKDENGNIITVKEELDRPITKYFYVFNVKQISFPPEHKYSKPLPLEEKAKPEQAFENLESVEKLIKDTGIKLIHAGNRAFYNPAIDLVVVPTKPQFKTQEGYYSTVLHEMSHWTGHQTRLNREHMWHSRKGTKNYAREELVAEISSFMLCLKHGIGHNLENHANYVEGYLGVLKDDRKELIKAVKEAFKAQNYVSKGSELQIKEEEKITLHKVDSLNLEKITRDTENVQGDEIANTLMQKGAYFDTDSNSFYITKKTHDLEKFREFLPKLNNSNTIQIEEKKEERSQSQEIQNQKDAKIEEVIESNTKQQEPDQALKDRAKSVSEICNIDEVKNAMDRIGLDDNLKNDILKLFDTIQNDKNIQTEKNEKVQEQNQNQTRGRGR